MVGNGERARAVTMAIRVEIHIRDIDRSSDLVRNDLAFKTSVHRPGREDERPQRASCWVLWDRESARSIVKAKVIEIHDRDVDRSREVHPTELALKANVYRRGRGARNGISNVGQCGSLLD